MKKVVVVVVLALAAAGSYAAFRARGEAPAEGEVVTVHRARIAVSVQEVGSIEPLRKVEIKSKVAGQVAEVLVDVGDKVKAGALLLKVDPLDAAREVRQMEAKTKITESQLAVAKAQLEFKKKAHSNGALSDLELSVAEGDVKRLEAQAQLEQVELQGARDRLSYTQVRAPIDGIVLARNVQPGEMIVPGVTSMVNGNPLLIVAQIEKLLVRSELNQIDVARIKLGDKVTITVDALPGQNFVGEVYRIAAMAAKSERRKESNLMVFPVDVIIDRSQPGATALRPGMMADINIALEAKDNVVAVPLEAVVREEGKTKVWRVKGEKLPDELVDIQTGIQNDREIEILGGVGEGDNIRINPKAPEGKRA